MIVWCSMNLFSADVIVSNKKRNDFLSVLPKDKSEMSCYINKILYQKINNNNKPPWKTQTKKFTLAEKNYGLNHITSKIKINYLI